MKPIQIFNRHCPFSAASQFKGRPDWFSRENCHLNLLNTLDPELCDIHAFFDEAHGKVESHFISKYKEKYATLGITSCGSESCAFEHILDYISSLLPSYDDTLIYIVEDDYLHKPNWSQILLEGYKSLEGTESYLTLYDHNDKYFYPQYANLTSKIFATKSCHWRSTPSTTNTYAMSLQQLMKDIEIHKAYSRGVTISRDHDKFVDLNKRDKILYSSLPGYSTHVAPEYMSPTTDWADIQSKTI